MQVVGREGVGEGLRALPVVDAQKGVVGKGETAAVSWRALMVTDPPYGVNYDPAWRNQAGRSINGTTQRIATGTVIKSLRRLARA